MAPWRRAPAMVSRTASGSSTSTNSAVISRTVPSVSFRAEQLGQIERRAGFIGDTGALRFDAGLLDPQIGQPLGGRLPLRHQFVATARLIGHQRHGELGVAVRRRGSHHVVELDDAAVKILDGGFGQGDALRERRRVAIDGKRGGDLTIEMRAAQKAERADRAQRHQQQHQNEQRQAQQQRRGPPLPRQPRYGHQLARFQDAGHHHDRHCGGGKDRRHAGDAEESGDRGQRRGNDEGRR